MVACLLSYSLQYQRQTDWKLEWYKRVPLCNIFVLKIIKAEDVKRVSYLSLEFLLGRLMQNALVNLDLEEKYKNSMLDIGYALEDLYEEEVDPALGNGGLGRLAACFLDSLSCLEIPAYGYGIRYDYGIFR